MSLFEDIKNQAETPPGVKCGVTIALLQMTEADRDDLQRALDDPGVKGTSISTVLRNRGIHVTGYTVQRHRRKFCSCDRYDTGL